MDEPPVVEIVAEGQNAAGTAAGEVQPHLPTQTLDDGTVLIDLKPLGPVPEQCLDQAPDPFNPEILVCAETDTSSRLGPTYGPSEEEEFGSAIPRAHVTISDNAEAQANVINKGVGGWNANGGEVRVKIDF